MDGVSDTSSSDGEDVSLLPMLGYRDVKPAAANRGAGHHQAGGDTQSATRAAAAASDGDGFDAQLASVIHDADEELGMLEAGVGAPSGTPDVDRPTPLTGKAARYAPGQGASPSHPHATPTRARTPPARSGEAEVTATEQQQRPRAGDRGGGAASPDLETGSAPPSHSSSTSKPLVAAAGSEAKAKPGGAWLAAASGTGATAKSAAKPITGMSGLVGTSNAVARLRWKRAVKKVSAATYMKRMPVGLVRDSSARSVKSRLATYRTADTEDERATTTLHRAGASDEGVHYTKPMTFNGRDVMREVFIFLTQPWLTPYFRVRYGKHFLWERDMDLRWRYDNVVQTLSSLTFQAAIVMLFMFPDGADGTGSVISTPQIFHALVLHISAALVVAFKRSLRVRGAGGRAVMDVREWVRASRTTLLQQADIAREQEGIVMERHKCVFDPADGPLVKLAMKPALDALPGTTVNIQEGTFPAELLLTRAVLSIERDTVEWENSVLNTERKHRSVFVRYQDSIGWGIAAFLVVLLPWLVRGLGAGGWNAESVLGGWSDLVITALFAFHGSVELQDNLLRSVVFILRIDIERRYELAQLFSAMLAPLDGGDFDKRLPPLDMLVPENLVSWFWVRSVVMSLARGMLHRVEIYANMVFTWVGLMFVFVVSQALFDSQVDSLMMSFTVCYSVLFLTLVVSVISMGGGVNTEGLANSLTLLRTRVRVREYLLMSREGRLEELRETLSGSGNVDVPPTPSDLSPAARFLTDNNDPDLVLAPTSSAYRVTKAGAAPASQRSFRFPPVGDDDTDDLGLGDAAVAPGLASALGASRGSVRSLPDYMESGMGGLAESKSFDGGSNTSLARTRSSIMARSGATSLVRTASRQANGTAAANAAYKAEVLAARAKARSFTLEQHGTNIEETGHSDSDTGTDNSTATGRKRARGPKGRSPPHPRSRTGSVASRRDSNASQASAAEDDAHDAGADRGRRSSQASARSSRSRRSSAGSTTGLERAVAAGQQPTKRRRSSAYATFDKVGNLKHLGDSGRSSTGSVAPFDETSDELTRHGGVDDVLLSEAAKGQAMHAPQTGALSADDPHAVATTRALLAEVLSLVDSVKDELKMWNEVRALKLVGIPMGPPLVRALVGLSVTIIGFSLRSMVQ